MCLLAPAARADVLYLRGKVVLADGSPPAGVVSIERMCAGGKPVKLTTADARGQFVWRTDFDITTTLAGSSGLSQANTTTGENVWLQGVRSVSERCVMRASLPGYESDSIDLSDLSWTNNPELPPLTLFREGTAPIVNLFDVRVPASAEAAWNRAMKALATKSWPEAEKQLRAVVGTAPRFAAGWNALALASQSQQKTAEARDAYHRAIAADPKMLAPYLLLTRLEMDAHQWDAAGKAAGELIQADAAHRYTEAYLDQAIARYHLNDLDGAASSIGELLRLDRNHEYPRAEYIFGLILEARRDYAGAGEHMRKYVELDPKAPDAAEVRERIGTLGKRDPAELGPELDALDLNLPAGGEAWVPGGIKAFAAIAHLKDAVTYNDLFLEYCRSIAHETSVFVGLPIPEYTNKLAAYMSAVVDLTRLGRRRGDSTVVTMSLAGDTERKKTAQILALLGWKLDDAGHVEPGDRPADGLRQEIPAAFGIDEVAMQKALEAGRSVQFEIPSENARLIGGAAWSALLKGTPLFPGGLADVLARDWRVAKAYAGVGAMDLETAAAVVKGVGLRTLVTQDSEVLALYGGDFAVSHGAAVVPGGEDAEAAWTRLAGAGPRDPPAFFRGILEKDHGDLAAFYSVLAHADAPHQRFFTQPAQRAERFYAWYRDSRELAAGVDRRVGTWRPAFFQKVPLDDAGHVRFPGGKPAWTASTGADEDLLLGSPEVEALVPVARVEEERKARLDEASARLLAQHYSDWSPLFRYFEQLPGLAGDDFQALAEFSDRVSALRHSERNRVLGQWHALVELTVLGTRSGAIAGAAGARAFRRACRDLTAPDGSAKALSIVRDLAGGGADIDEAVAARLLRLTGARRAAFDRVKELQSVPRLDSLSGSADAEKILAALAGQVYAALLPPDSLLVAENPLLVSRHRYILESEARRPPLFWATELTTSGNSSGAFLAGGFMTLEDESRDLARFPPPAERAADATAPEPKAAAAPLDVHTAGATEAVFHANARLVEVYATVTDGGRYVDDLKAGDFTILENGKPVPAVAFENRTSSVSCVLLFDTTGSMQAALPALKNAAFKLIGEFRPIDSVAVYSFSSVVQELEPFTTDQDAARRAVLRTRAFGTTALYDALTRTVHDLAHRSGKKVIVVFTDGIDNASVLTTATAIDEAQGAGVPIYTIAQGDALKSPALLRQLAGISKTTGGGAFTIHGPSEIREVFESVSRDLMHGYLLAFQPAPGDQREWRTIELVLRGSKGRKIRAREGYYPE